ncbi:MAG: hypothetical protein V3V01_04280 [Acidimicrobiales bacterium]
MTMLLPGPEGRVPGRTIGRTSPKLAQHWDGSNGGAVSGLSGAPLFRSVGPTHREIAGYGRIGISEW